MTFDDARKAAIESFDAAAKELRALIVDPGFCNPDWRKYLDAAKKLNDATARIVRLNQVEAEATPSESKR